MAKFRKKPVVIEAVRWDGKPPTYDTIQAMESAELDEQVAICIDDNTLMISTLEGDMTAQVGDWIIKGIKGELYPCKDDIFLATYEPVSE